MRQLLRLGITGVSSKTALAARAVISFTNGLALGQMLLLKPQGTPISVWCRAVGKKANADSRTKTDTVVADASQAICP